MSKRSDAIEIMKANAKLPMADVVALIADRIGVTDANAKSYYKWIVANGKAPGEVVASARAPKAAKAPKVAKVKMVKVPKPKVQGDKPKVTDKTVEELADIKAKNLARLKAVGAKYQKGQYADGARGRIHTDAQARAEVSNLENELDSFKAPKFLNMADVKALV
jgi:hypothetical protein